MSSAWRGGAMMVGDTFSGLLKRGCKGKGRGEGHVL